ncbi:unnamed protein product, partial [Owenia fusiformis]
MPEHFNRMFLLMLVQMCSFMFILFILPYNTSFQQVLYPKPTSDTRKRISISNFTLISEGKHGEDEINENEQKTYNNERETAMQAHNTELEPIQDFETPSSSKNYLNRAANTLKQYLNMEIIQTTSFYRDISKISRKWKQKDII